MHRFVGPCGVGVADVLNTIVVNPEAHRMDARLVSREQIVLNLCQIRILLEVCE